jgi:hypothetical protein
MSRFALVIVALSVALRPSAAQDLNRPVLDFGAVTSGQIVTSSLPLFLQAGREPQRLDFNRELAKSLKHEKQCPMPVYRPDTSRHDSSLPVQLSAVKDPWIIAVIDCPNPLDSKASVGPYTRGDSTLRPKAPGIF